MSSLPSDFSRHSFIALIGTSVTPHDSILALAQMPVSNIITADCPYGAQTYSVSGYAGFPQRATQEG